MLGHPYMWNLLFTWNSVRWNLLITWNNNYSSFIIYGSMGSKLIPKLIPKWRTTLTLILECYEKERKKNTIKLLWMAPRFTCQYAISKIREDFWKDQPRSSSSWNHLVMGSYCVRFLKSKPIDMYHVPFFLRMLWVFLKVWIINYSSVNSNWSIYPSTNFDQSICN
jgi:hypothetical protein